MIYNLHVISSSARNIFPLFVPMTTKCIFSKIQSEESDALVFREGNDRVTIFELYICAKSRFGPFVLVNIVGSFMTCIGVFNFEHPIPLPMEQKIFDLYMPKSEIYCEDTFVLIVFNDF